MTERGQKDVVGIVKFNWLIGLLPTNPIKLLLYYNGIPEIMMRHFDVNIKQCKILKNWQTSAIIGEISYMYSNLETGRYSPKSEVSWMLTALCMILCKPFRH